MTNYPNGWISARLDEVCHIEMGQSPPSSTYNTGGLGLPFLQGKAEFGELYPAPAKFCSRPSKIARSGSVLLSVRAPVGPTNITPSDCCIGRGLAAISPLGDIPSRFVLWALRFHEPALAELGTGSTFSAVSKSQVTSIPIALPPLNEQHRIVDKIEALFDQIDRGVESLRTARRTTDLYRQSLLKSAFKGRLTAEWRTENQDKIESPDALVARIWHEREQRCQTDLDGWQRSGAEWKKAGEKGRRPAKPKQVKGFDLLRSSDRLPWPNVRVEALLDVPLVNGRSAKDKAGGFPVLRLTALKNGKIDLRESKEGDWSRDDAEPFLVKRDDIFVSRGNGSKNLVGIGGRVLREPMPVAFPDTMIRVRLDTSAVRPEFFVLVWNSWAVRRQIEMAARTTAGIYKINQGHIRAFVLPLPSLSEQSEIVRILEERLESTDALQVEIDANLAHVEALRQSILKRAFSGQLVPQDPADEPAQALLARIRTSRDQGSIANPRRATRRGANTPLPP